MAASIRKTFLRALLLDRQAFSPITFCQLRGAKYDPKEFLEPTVSKEELEKPLKESDLRKYMRIKAALTDDSTFADYDPIVSKFINMIMKEGDKKLARSLMAKTFEEIKHIQVGRYHRTEGAEKVMIELEPVKVFHAAVENVKPLLTTTKVRRGGVTYQVPIPCGPKTQSFKSMKWLIECSSAKEDNVRFYKALAKEILDAYEHKGKAIDKKMALHKLCEENKAYAHYRWA